MIINVKTTFPICLLSKFVSRILLGFKNYGGSKILSILWKNFMKGHYNDVCNFNTKMSLLQ